MKLDVTEYTVRAPVSRRLTAAVMSDIHGENFDRVDERVHERRPDMIFIPGDIVNRHDREPGNGEAFLRFAASGSAAKASALPGRTPRRASCMYAA